MSSQSLNDPGLIVCLDPATGKRRWSILNTLRFGSLATHVVNGGTVVSAITLDHRLVTLQPQTGKVLSIAAIASTETNWFEATYLLAINDGFVYIVGSNQKLLRYDLSKLATYTSQ